MIEFEKPNYNVVDYIEGKTYGRFELEPLERGFGTTLGNALRRVMLSSLPGTSVSSIKINGVLHEFQTMDGVVEDITTIILNLKDLVIRNHSNESKIIRINKKTEGPVTAADIEADADIEILNPDLVIANLAKGGKLEMEMKVTNGRGYVRAEDNKKILDINTVGEIATDSNYSPIEKVTYDVEKTRVGQDENYDKLILSVWTNGALKPEEAVALASKILIEHFNVLTNLSSLAETTNFMNEGSEVEEVKSLEIPVEDLELSARALNCLVRAEIKTLDDLVNLTEDELSNIKNLGKKSLKEILDKLDSLDLDLKEDD